MKVYWAIWSIPVLTFIGLFLLDVTGVINETTPIIQTIIAY